MKNAAIALMALLAAPPAAEAAVLYVKAGGTGNCSSWSSACATPDAAMTLANAGDEIWVAAVPLDPGTGIDFYYLSSSYTGSGVGIVSVKDGVSIYGGFNGTETTRGQRNVTGNVTKFLLEMRYRALTDLLMTIDGFTFINGSDAAFLLGDDGSAGTCALLTISHNSLMNGGYTFGAIYAWQPPFVCSPTIQGNTFYSGSKPIYIPMGAPKILNNLFTELGWTKKEGIQIGGGGVSPPPDSSGAVVANNILWGMWVYVGNPGVLVANNTVMAGTIGSVANTYGIITAGGTTLVNNIVAFYDTGIFVSGSITEHHNLVYGNNTNYSGVSPGPGDINLDPLVVDRANGDLHLTSASPARDAGDNSVVQPGWTDYDGRPRIRPVGGIVDMGAYEYAPATPAQFYTVTPCRVADTRNPAGPYGGPSLAAGADRTFVFGGQCGIPATASAVALNVVAILPTDGPGFLTLYPAGAARPLAATMNYKAGKVRANNAIIPLGASAGLTVHCEQGTGTANMVIDVVGYFQ